MMDTPGPSQPRSLMRDFSLSAVAAGFVTVLVGFTSTAAIVFQAAESLGATPEQISSWMSLAGIGSAFWGLVAGVIALRVWQKKKETETKGDGAS